MAATDAPATRRVPPAEVAAIVGAVVATAGLGALANAGEVDSRWYRSLDLPSWQPPGAVFGPVWTVLYALIAAAMLDVRRRPHRGEYATFVLFGGNLVLNLAWTLIFFRGHSPLWAGVEIVVLEATTVALVVRTRPVSRRAALCLVPYALWVAFATALTWTIAATN